MKKATIFLCLFVITQSICAQFSRYIIQLKDKNNNGYSLSQPNQYLSTKAIQKRVKYNISIDSTDLPATPNYISQIKAINGVTILNVSKWFNQIAVQIANPTILQQITNLPFVKSSNPIALRIKNNNDPKEIETKSINNILQKTNEIKEVFNYGNALNQLQIHKGDFLHRLGFTGINMNIGITDAGFFNYNTIAAFDSVRLNNRIKETYDFVLNELNVANDHPHGMHCFSIMAAELSNTTKYTGTSPKANYYLYKTEDINSEYPIEEQNWVAAAERADSIGLDVISVSLGYTVFSNSQFNYTHAMLDGKTALISKAANLAGKKGILVVAAAGNDGNNAWQKISTPADAENILTVGAIAQNLSAASLSSIGPTADGRVKPDVVAVGIGTSLIQTDGSVSAGNGTSFATPIIAGLATCLWQAFPEFNNIEIIKAIQKSSHIFNAPTNKMGYGIPDFKKAFVQLIMDNKTKLEAQINCITKQIAFNWKAKNHQQFKYYIQLKNNNNQYNTIDSSAYSGMYKYDSIAKTIDIPNDINPVKEFRLLLKIATDTIILFDSISVNLNICNTQTSDDYFKIYPNPIGAGKKLYIKSKTGSNSLIQIIIYNELGQQIFTKQLAPSFTETITEINTVQFTTGVYFVTIFKDDKKTYTKKIIF